jgi:hypothetical protein
MTRERFTFDEVVRDSRELLEPSITGARIDWANVDARLFARIDAEAASNVVTRTTGGRAWSAVAGVLAIAAGVAALVGRPAVAPGPALGEIGETAAETREDATAGALVWKEGAGEVRIGVSGAVASSGTGIARGDAVETHGVRAGFERMAHGQTSVVWALEDASRATVKSTRGALVLALERGAVEAQVTPVAYGEAFAVDVDGARVAVHGTHLRVLRDGQKVVVDLTEGVVSIGAPPRAGSTLGPLVTAPAHIEFDANDPIGTLKVSHEAARVRAALALRPPPEQVATVTPRVALPPPADAHPAPVVALPHAPAPLGAAPKVGERVTPPATPEAPEPVAPPSAPPAAPPARPDEAIADAVRNCVRAHASSHQDGLVVTVSSTLHLEVNDTGAVTSAKFDPPLEPEVQTCASHAIFAGHFTQPGLVTIPIRTER